MLARRGSQSPRTSGYQAGYGGLTLDPQLAGAMMVSTLDH